MERLGVYYITDHYILYSQRSKKQKKYNLDAESTVSKKIFTEYAESVYNYRAERLCHRPVPMGARVPFRRKGAGGSFVIEKKD